MRARLQRLNRGFVQWMATTSGRSLTFWLFVGWYLSWIAWNTVAPGPWRFDPYPYAFLLFLSNTIQLWYLPIITMQSDTFNALLRQLLEQLTQNEQVQTSVLHEVQVQNEALTDGLTVIREVVREHFAVSQRATATLERVEAILARIEAKTTEIDAEVDALTEREGMGHGD
ncbi:DUF1003 domain-containing protein [Sulfobacillus harzensis]|uniref:DUF1003 domain-containing protein n=1 Tax=Sulfobacillus harzensis TaxID=2729629 RepID=A0A7Y0Q103_9FIRM|nr:DUF1003 domain-containing protein [Sulfobacillus harzensis]NMP20795.1 DUF1003 domain-containing protein [Sulfobacillus harzensis]